MRTNDPKQRSASTIHDLRLLRRRLYECMFMMRKADRVVYGDALLNYAALTQMWFIRSYEAKDIKDKYEAACNAAMYFSVLREDISEDVECNIIKFPKRKVKDADKMDAEALAIEQISGRKIELVALVAKIDEGVGRWRNSLEGQARPRCDFQGVGS